MVDMTETESRLLEKLKRFWSRFGNLILWGVVLVIAAFAIWTYWQRQQANKVLEASAQFLQLENDLQSGLQADTIITEANALMQKYSSTVYAKFSGLLIANEYVEQKNYQAASANLDWVIKNSDADPAIKSTAILRLARLKIMLNQAQNAIDLINQSELPESYQALGDLVKADAYISLANEEKARASLISAQTLLNQAKSLDDAENDTLIKESKDYIKMKLSNLNVLIQLAQENRSKLQAQKPLVLKP